MFKKQRNQNYRSSAKNNNRQFNIYYERLTELALTTFEWLDLPETVDERFLELTLFKFGQAIYFRDEAVGDIALTCTSGGYYDIYNVPTKRMAYAANGYQRHLTNENSVLIYNNYLRTNSISWIEYYAERLYNFDRIIDVNVNAQKTPILLLCDENDRLAARNLYMQYDGNVPFIMGSKRLSEIPFSVLKTDAPFVSDRIYQLKLAIWNDALTFLGIPNVAYEKAERIITDEVASQQGVTYMSRYSRLLARQQAVEKINDMFGTDISVQYRKLGQPEITMPGSGADPFDAGQDPDQEEQGVSE